VPKKPTFGSVKIGTMGGADKNKEASTPKEAPLLVGSKNQNVSASAIISGGIGIVSKQPSSALMNSGMLSGGRYQTKDVIASVIH